jgi:hypothetical protein
MMWESGARKCYQLECVDFWVEVPSPLESAVCVSCAEVHLFLCVSWVVLATVLGYPAVVRVWNRTRWLSPGCYPESRGTHQLQGRIGTGPRFHFMVPTTFAAIKYVNSDHIATWSICVMCRFMPYFISHSQICDQIDIYWIILTLSWKSWQNDRVSITTPRPLFRLQIAEREMKEGIELHISRIHYVAIRWELQYWIGARNVDFWRVGCGW